MLRSALLAAALLTAAAVTAFAQKPPDSHYVATRTSAIARRSVFIHGYLHGYEEGFHFADMDTQMGRASRDISKVKDAREPVGYRREFGNKRVFESAYRQGLRVGYADGMAGRAFRAIAELEAIAALAGGPAQIQPDAAFDEGFSAGYASGQRQGIEDGRRDPTYAPPLPACPPTAVQAHSQQTYCTAYTGGYRIGYSDGFINVARRATAQVEARGGK
jgi:hypothetical protein